MCLRPDLKLGCRVFLGLAGNPLRDYKNLFVILNLIMPLHSSAAIKVSLRSYP